MSELYERYPCLLKCREDIEAVRQKMINIYENGGKVLVCGNGGSCADSEHIVGELMKGFLMERSVGEKFFEKLKMTGCEDAEYIMNHLQGALPAISLPSQSTILSAFANDVSAEMVYAQMVYGYGSEKDLLICLSTSGNSKNVVYAARVARAKGMQCIALTGQKDSELSKICDITIRVPEIETYKVQELHLPVYHYLCVETEKYFFDTINENVRI